MGGVSHPWLGRNTATAISYTKQAWVNKPGPYPPCDPPRPQAPLPGIAPLPPLPLPRHRLGKGEGVGFVLQQALVLIATNSGARNGPALTRLAPPAAPVHAAAPPAASPPVCAMPPSPQLLPPPTAAPRSPQKRRSWPPRHLPSLPVCTTPLPGDQVGARPPVPTQLLDAAGTPRRPEQPRRQQGKHGWVWEHLPIEFRFTNEHGAEVTVRLLARSAAAREGAEQRRPRSKAKGGGSLRHRRCTSPKLPKEQLLGASSDPAALLPGRGIRRGSGKARLGSCLCCC